MHDSKTPRATPGWWRSGPTEIASFCQEEVKIGFTRTLCTSPGGRNIEGVFYGRPETDLRGKANWSSALGAGDPQAYYRRGKGIRKKPVFFVLAGVHGLSDYRTQFTHEQIHEILLTLFEEAAAIYWDT